MCMYFARPNVSRRNRRLYSRQARPNTLEFVGGSVSVVGSSSPSRNGRIVKLQQINHYPLDKYYQKPLRYPIDRDLSN